LELLGAGWENVTHIFSIEKLNQRNTTRPKAQSIYQRIGEAPWGCIRESRPDIVVVTQPPEYTLRHEWMERIMPRDATAGRTDRVLLIGTVEDYMTVGHKLWEKQLFARGYDPTSWLVYEEYCGPPTRGGGEWQPCVFGEVHLPIASPSLFLCWQRNNSRHDRPLLP
jgi:hypothetical protein